MMPKTSSFWFIRDGDKLIQCSKDNFDKAIIDGKSVKYRGYANKKAERMADQLEESRMSFLAKTGLSSKFRAAITNPRNVVEVQVVLVADPEFWQRESKRPKYHE